VEIVTNSRAKAWRRCARLHFFLFVLGVRAIEDVGVLRFGTLIHLGLEAWWLALLPYAKRHALVDGWQEADFLARRVIETEAEADHRIAIRNGDSLAAALAAVAGKAADPYEQARVEEMLRGYHFRWQAEDLEPIAVEAEFRAPLVNPETGALSRTYELGGKLDVLARARSTGRIVIIEHKTSSEDVSTGSPYWSRLRIDGQVSHYLAGARALGYAAASCVYDVLAKPAQRPAKATPAEERKYTLPKYKACPACKRKGAPPAPHLVDVAPRDVDGAAIGLLLVLCEPDPEDATKHRVCTDPGGRLYANLRAEDETPDEYRARLVDALAEAPERYFARGDVVRLEHDEHEHASDVWRSARNIRDAQLAGERLVQIGRDAKSAHPRNPDACFTYGRPCAFFAVCTGAASIDDPARFERVDNVHQELAIAAS
jgi:hypothetical protein